MSQPAGNPGPRRPHHRPRQPYRPVGCRPVAEHGVPDRRAGARRQQRQRRVRGVDDLSLLPLVDAAHVAAGRGDLVELLNSVGLELDRAALWLLAMLLRHALQIVSFAWACWFPTVLHLATN